MPELRFLSWEKPFLPAATSFLAQGFGGPGVLDLRGTRLVVPGARSGRRLLELLVEEASSSGRRLVPPDRILTVGSLPEELYAPPVPVASGALARRSWALALERSSGETLTTALGPQAQDQELEARVGYARFLDSLNRTVGASCLSFRSVAEECRRGFLFSDEDRWNALALIQEKMRSILGAEGFCDREEARHRALLEGRVKDRQGLILVGVAEAPLVTRRMLGRVADELTILVHAPPGEAEAFDSLGMVVVGAWHGRPIPLPGEELVVGDTPGDQAEEAVSFLRGLEARHAPEDVTFGVPDPSLVPFLARHLGERGIATRYAEGTPLSQSPPARLLNATAEYLAGGRFNALADLLRHPDLPPDLAPEMAPELADAFFGAHFPDLVASAGQSGERGDPAFRGLLRTLHGPGRLAQLNGRARISDWMPRILSYLASLYGLAALPRDLQHRRTVAEALLQIRDAAEELHRLPAGLDEVCGAQQALSVLLGELRDARIPPDPREDAVELVGWLELQLDDAPVIVLTGVADPFLPESVNADILLPNALRARLGLEDNQARYARDAYRLTAILHSTRHRRVIAARRNAAGDPLRPSRLLLTGDDREMAERVLRLAGDSRESRRRQRAPLRLPQSVREGFRLPPEPFLPVPDLSRPLPVTAFRLLLEDPYLWALGQSLGLQEAEYDLQELDPLSFGTLAHRVMESFARSPEAASTDPEAVGSRLRRILDGTARERYGRAPLPTVSLQVEQLRTRLDAFAHWQAARIRKGWEILAVEARTPPEGVAFDVDGEPIFLSARVDRIDRHKETGAWALLDYKTGDAGVDLSDVRGRDGVWKDLQLPLYHTIRRDLRSQKGSLLDPPAPGVPVQLAYLPLSRSQGPVEEVVAGWTPDDLASAEETAREVIRALRNRGGIAFDEDRSGRRARGGMATLLGQGLLQAAEAEE